MKSFETKNSTDNTVLRGRVWEAESPKAVMSLVHGFGEHCGRYDDMAQYLNTHNISVIALDLHGHGLTDGPRGYCPNYELLLEDLDILLGKTRDSYPGLPHILYGHSMGGGLVLHHQLKNTTMDLNAIIASAPLIEPADPVPNFQRSLVKLLCKILPKSSLPNRIDGSKISRLPAEQDAYLSDPLNHGKLGVGLAVGIVEGGEWIRENAQSWAKPLLLVHSREDRLTRFSASEAFAAKAQNCTFIPYEDCEHEIHNDCHREHLYKAMSDFIESQIS